MPEEAIQNLIISQLRDNSATTMHLAERMSGLEVKVNVIDQKLDTMGAKIDKIFERDDVRLTNLETFKYQTQGVLAFILLIFAPFCAFIGWYMRNSSGISAVAKTIGVDFP